MNTPNPFHSPKQSRVASAAALADLAKEINVMLAKGIRLIRVPVGIADAAAQEIRDAHEPDEPGWSVGIKDRNEETAALVISEMPAPVGSA